MLDENFQYFMLAFYWYCNKPIAGETFVCSYDSIMMINVYLHK